MHVNFFRVNAEEDINSFDCGDADLNEFILHDAVLYRKAKLAVSLYFDLDEVDQ